jgi:8-oxoguanine deaminase
MHADLALFLLDELRFSRVGDRLAALVLCGASHADRVMIKGLLADGSWPHPQGLDLDVLRAYIAAARNLAAL